MNVFALADVLAAMHGKLLAAGEESFAGVSTDSRTVKPNELFFALSGERFDAHDYVVQAQHRGASGAVVEHLITTQGLSLIEVKNTRVALGDLARFWRSHHTISCVAITGSNGKTTTKDFCKAIFSQVGPTLATQGNLNNDIGLPLTLLGLRNEHRHAIVELGMNARGEIAYLASIAQPNVGVITNVSLAHVGKLGSVEEVAQAKGELFHAIAESGVVVRPSWDARLAAIASSIPRSRQILFGDEPSCDVQLVHTEPMGTQGQLCTLRLRKRQISVRLSLCGRHNAYNALAASAAALALEVELGAVALGLEAANFSPHRSNLISIGERLVLDDCYNANPSSMRAALDTLAELVSSTQGRAVAVLGDMLELGANETRLHQEIGRHVAAQRVDLLICVGNKLAPLIAEGARAAGMDPGAVRNVGSAAEAAQALLSLTHPGDAILVKASRGARLEQVIEHFQKQTEAR